MERSIVAAKAAPLFARLLSKLVLEVLPASLASIIGAVLLAHYQFGHPAASAGIAAAAPGPASPEMLQLVRDEHDLIRNFLNAQQAAQEKRYVTADAPSAQVTADAELAAAVAARRAADAVAAKAPASRVRAAAATAPLPAAVSPAPAPAAAVPAVIPAPQALPAVADVQNSAAPASAPEHRSLMVRLLAAKDHVVHAPLRAVMTIGGIPSWIGHRLGSDQPELEKRMFSAAS